MSIIDEFKRNFYKDGTKEFHRGKIISSIIVVMALIAFVLYKNSDMSKKAQDRTEHPRYTIGVTGAMHKNFKSSKPTVEFFYSVSQKKYEGFEHIDASFEKNVQSNGGRYYVQFSYENPANSRLLLAYPVPDTVSLSPESGWSYMPGINDKK